ncbi:hypothetical protein [Phaeobacter sp. C3_T13_0]|uniref:hypothetical protein n=1 Tax=Phaeobacter cretensis TaxID=3342641 RepID=UPI0039BC265A
MRFKKLQVAPHLVDFVGDIEGIHHPLASFVSMGVQNAGSCLNALGKGSIRPVCLQLIIFDKVYASQRREKSWQRSTEIFQRPAR